MIAGVVATSSAWAVRSDRCASSPAPCSIHSPAYLLHRGLQTLAGAGARPAGECPADRRAPARPSQRDRGVPYPGLPGSDPQRLSAPATRPWQPDLVPAAVRPSARRGQRRTLVPAVASAGDADRHRRAHASLRERRRSAASGIRDGLFRLSVGLEDPADLLADIGRRVEVGAAVLGRAERVRRVEETAGRRPLVDLLQLEARGCGRPVERGRVECVTEVDEAERARSTGAAGGAGGPGEAGAAAARRRKPPRRSTAAAGRAGGPGDPSSGRLAAATRDRGQRVLDVPHRDRATRPASSATSSTSGPRTTSAPRRRSQV